MSLAPHLPGNGPLAIGLHNILCYGATSTGLFTTLILADYWADAHFTVTDHRDGDIQRWRDLHEDHIPPPPVMEIGFLPLYIEYANRINFEVVENNLIQNADLIILAVEKPTKTSGVGVKGKADLTDWDMAVRRIAGAAHQTKVIIDKFSSEVDMKYGADKLIGLLNSYGPQPPVVHHLFLHPDNFPLGRGGDPGADGINEGGYAIETLRNGVLYVAAADGNQIQQFRNVYYWIDNNDVNVVPWRNLAGFDYGRDFLLNLKYRGVRALSNFYTVMGLDVETVIETIENDEMSGFRLELLRPSTDVGIGHSQHRSTAYVAHALGEKPCYADDSKFAKTILSDKKRMKRFISIMEEKMVSLGRKLIAILGFSFREYTTECRTSPALYLARLLKKEKIRRIKIYDPLVSGAEIRRYLRLRRSVSVHANVLEACHQADAVCIMHKALNFWVADWNACWNAMAKPAFVFDFAHTGWDFEVFTQLGFRVHVAGLPY